MLEVLNKIDLQMKRLLLMLHHYDVLKSLLLCSLNKDPRSINSHPLSLIMDFLCYISFHNCRYKLLS